ncbi:inositol monophosphatase [bacterium]|nr:inositol monophosphatase [bacterium]
MKTDEPLTDETLTKALLIAKRAAYRAGEHAREMRNSHRFSIQYKNHQHNGSRDLVTEADLQCEAIILEIIREAFPEHRILSEESTPNIPSDELLKSLHHGPLWVIDPIDGTTNFAHDQPCVGISIAFAFDGVRQIGVVSCPFLSELFYATKGGGAFRIPIAPHQEEHHREEVIPEPISVTPVTEPEQALIGTGFPYQRTHLSGVLTRLHSVLREFRDLRRLGAASVDLCFVACGRLDGFYEDLKPWDVAAGLLIAAEAGAVIGRFEEQPEKEAGIGEHSRAWMAPRGETPTEIDGSDLVVAAPGVFDALLRAVSPSR